jgi:hypothetical protein
MIPFLILLITITSCNKDSNKEPIDSKILISAHKNEGRVVMKCKTEKVYPCLGYEIVYKKNVSNNKININFKNIVSHEPCLTALGPASCEITFPQLGNGAYDLEFKLNNSITKGKLFIEDEMFVISIDPGGNVVIN